MTALARIVLLAATVVVQPVITGPVAARQTAPAAAPLKARLDALLAASYPADGPGATMIVTKGGRTIYAGASGLADVEGKVALTPASVIRMGSITKQFTAAVILQLVGESKLSLDDPLGKFFPGYPAPGGTATVRQLLNHTSGIQSYTGIPGWMVAANTGRAFTTDALIAEFRDKPVEFQPGEKWNYNNSGYVLLGGIIERVTGMPWYAAIDTRIVKPLGLTTIRYGNPPVGAAWAKPYSQGDTGIEPAQAIDMSVPQAAGGLVGSVGDLARWAQALHHGRVVPPALYAQMIAPTRLNDGSTNRYGFGLSNGTLRGLAELDHSGGIFGGATDSLYVPSEDLFVAVFANTDAPPVRPGVVLRRAAALALGRPFAKFTPQTPDMKMIDPMLGVYRSADGTVERRVFARDGTLFLARGSTPPRPLSYVGDGRFSLGANDLTWFAIRPDGAGYALELHQGGEDAIEHAVRTGPIPPPAAAVTLPRATLERYVGRYTLPIGEATVALGQGDALTIQIAGQPAFPLEPTSETAFRVVAVGADVVFDGTTLKIRQGPGEMSGARVK